MDDDRIVQSFDIEHYNIKQRWHVLSSETSRQRAIKQVDKQVLKEVKIIEKELFHLQVKRFDSTAGANELGKKWKLHKIKEYQLVEHNIYNRRPKKIQKPDKIQYQIVVTITHDEEQINKHKYRTLRYRW